MARWQRRARLLIAVFAIAFAVVVFFAFRKQPPAPPAPSINRLGPNAVVESTGGHVVRVKGTREDVAIDFEKEVTYQNGSSKLMNVTVTTTNRSDGRVFVMKAKEGQATDNPVTYLMDGDVRLTASDGLTVKTEHATYAAAEAIVRVPGPVELGKGRIAAQGVGLTYDKNGDVLTILDRASVHVRPDEKGAGAAEITSATAVFVRRDKYIRFERDVKVVRGGRVTEADGAIAHLSADETRIENVELHGNARMSEAAAAAGALQHLSGRDMTVKYAANGETIEHVGVDGSAAIEVAGETGKAGRQIAANTLDVALAPDGSTPLALVGHHAVQVTFPAEQGVGLRTIRANDLDAKGEAGRGLTRARFTGNVDYREAGGPAAKANALDVALKPGMTVDEARFAGNVRIDKDEMEAQAAVGRYLLDKGIVELTGSEPPPGVVTPHVTNKEMSVTSARIDVTLAGPKLKANGTVKSLIVPPKKDAPKADTHVPSMFKQDQPVNVIGDALDYDGGASKATYTGHAQLFQGDTSIRGDTIVIDDKTGDLSATGSVATSVMLEQVNTQTKAKQRVRSLGTSKEFKYADAIRRATYTGDAHLSGPEGDVTSPKIELYLKPSGDELDRAEAYEAVTLRESGRKTTGDRLTYFADTERYEVTGTPVKIVDECGGETVGKALTFDKAADTIVLDGKKQFRTQSKGSSKCSSY